MTPFSRLWIPGNLVAALAQIGAGVKPAPRLKFNDREF